MKFEILDEKGKAVFNTNMIECIPVKNHIDMMSKSGYKFKIDNKIISKKKLEEFITENKRRTKNDKV